MKDLKTKQPAIADFFVERFSDQVLMAEVEMKFAQVLILVLLIFQLYSSIRLCCYLLFSYILFLYLLHSYRRAMSPQKRMQLLFWMLCLTLHVDDYVTAISDITLDLHQTLKETGWNFRALGCVMKGRNEYAVPVYQLKLPLVFAIPHRKR